MNYVKKFYHDRKGIVKDMDKVNQLQGGSCRNSLL